MSQRKHAPVFVIGCHRSGTALLYDTLLSSGGFPQFHASNALYTTLLPKCGDLRSRRNRERLMQFWLRSKQFRRSGLVAEDIHRRVLEECRTGGDFLHLTMGEMARREGAERWAVYDPDNILFMRRVKREVPDALFVHIVRDGRDAAISLRKAGSARPLPWDRKRALLSAGLNWKWTVRKGRHDAQLFPGDYMEIRYEELVERPAQALAPLAEFLQHDLDSTAFSRIASDGSPRPIPFGKTKPPAEPSARSIAGKPDFPPKRLPPWKA